MSCLHGRHGWRMSSHLRFRIVLTLFTSVVIYFMIWIFKFQIVSYHTVIKTALPPDKPKMLKTFSNLTLVELDQTVGKTYDSNFGKVLTNTDSENNIHDLERNDFNDKRKKTLINSQYTNIDRSLGNSPRHMHGAPLLPINSTSIRKDHLRVKQTKQISEIKSENNFENHFQELESAIPQRDGEVKINQPYQPKIGLVKPGYTLTETKEIARPIKEQNNFIQMTLNDVPKSRLSVSQSDLTFEKQKSKLNMSLTYDRKLKKLDTVAVSQNAKLTDTLPKGRNTRQSFKKKSDLPRSQTFNVSNPSTYRKSKFNTSESESNKSRDDQVLTQSIRLTFASCKTGLNVSNQTKIGILIPSSTRNIKNPTLKHLTLVNTSIPSVYKTLEKEYIYRIYIGIDEGDYLQTVQEEIKIMFDCAVPVIVRGKNYVKSVNAIATRAYEDGMDYLVRVNDDTLFVTPNWTSKAISRLKDYNPENVGVVGPTCKEGNTDILTHDMVHRKHLEIFDFYYPPYLENWWTDDWITRVYEPNKSTKLESWVVKHIIISTRYKVDKERNKWSKTLIEYDRNRLQKYLGCPCLPSRCSRVYNNVHTWLFLFVALTLTLNMNNV